MSLQYLDILIGLNNNNRKKQQQKMTPPETEAQI